MAKSPEEVVFEGWLTKSPPTKRIWRAKWRRRWFLLTHSGNIPGQYVLTYYTDRNRRKLKGVIDLDHCEQVDLGLKLEERKLKFDHIFGIKTPNRTYYLAADTEEEMKSWVTCICRVCSLKCTNEDEDVNIPMNSTDIEITEENANRTGAIGATPPVSPVSTSPYIPISECITGKSPIFDLKDFKSLLEYNQRHSSRYTAQNDMYEFHSQNSYVNLSQDPGRNYVNDVQDPRFYDCPRQLTPQKGGRQDVGSPLQSPTASDNVFNDEEWVQRNVDSDLSRRLSSSVDESMDPDPEPVAAQKSIRLVDAPHTLPPPRPPKSSHVNTAAYLNLAPTPTKKSRGNENEDQSGQVETKVISDDMYDFPRSHTYEAEASKGTLQRRHCYNNAAPTKCAEGTVFHYDVSPKPSTSSITSVFRYDLEATQNLEPSSPAHSHSSSTAAYSNLPSPLLSESQLMPPPTVNRDLKPRRKLSDTLSTSSYNEPPSPRTLAPSVDRKLKPPTPLQEANMRKSFHLSEEDGIRKIRAAPSPTPPGQIDDTYQNQDSYQYLSNRMQYLDLDLEGAASNSGSKVLPKASETDTVYKKVDFRKTEAFNITRNNLEKERQEPVTTFAKK
ncbi:hypothetical protein HUJ04_009413 [Dendroctonus ponderosae]|uniref:PH domain-containing protein n=1 Tax=Dendroctonus ponderosae TaxID=77166 RepID=A0AAR5QKS1_DENPD|nr:hypothetical protein HUJ04_009413 [Dendroctonus ponderosae]